MSLSNLDRHYLDQREALSWQEADYIDNIMSKVYIEAKHCGVITAMDDRAASLEASIIRFILESKHK